MCVHVSVCVCVCGCVRSYGMYVQYVRVCMYMSLCVCVCIHERMHVSMCNHDCGIYTAIEYACGHTWCCWHSYIKMTHSSVHLCTHVILCINQFSWHLPLFVQTPFLALERQHQVVYSLLPKEQASHCVISKHSRAIFMHAHVYTRVCLCKYG